MGKPIKRRGPRRWTMTQIRRALRSVKVEIRSPFNPLPRKGDMTDLHGIEEFYEALQAQKDDKP